MRFAISCPPFSRFFFLILFIGPKMVGDCRFCSIFDAAMFRKSRPAGCTHKVPVDQPVAELAGIRDDSFDAMHCCTRT